MALCLLETKTGTYSELPWPHLIAGQAALAKGDAKAAVASLTLSLAINPFDASVHCGLAEAYKQLPEVQVDKRQRAERDRRELASSCRDSIALDAVGSGAKVVALWHF